MILILRQRFDAVAERIALSMGGQARSLVIDDWLSSCRTHHLVHAHGTLTQIEDLAGPLLDDSVTLVLNRVAQVPAPRFEHGAAADHGYAVAEATALMWSCLAGLACPVLNSALVLGMVGRAGSPLVHAAVAHRCGLRTRSFRLMTRARYGDQQDMGRLDAEAGGGNPAAAGTSGPAWFASRTTGAPAEVWIVGERVVGQVDGVDRASVRRFARQLGMGFGVLRFEQNADGQWLWTALDALPQRAPPAVLEALRDFLGQHVRTHADKVPS